MAVTVNMVPTHPPAGADVGQAIPDTAHAVSVSLPSWKANIAYEEGDPWILSRMKNGYPRFFIHLSIQAFAEALVARFGKAGEKAFLFPSSSVAARCRDFVMRYTPCSLRCNYQHATFKIKDIEVVDLILREPDVDDGGLQQSTTVLSMVIVPDSIYPVAKQFWQHSGDGVSSRRAEFFHKAFDDGHLEPRISNELLDSSSRLVNKGPRRYQRTEADDSAMIHSSFETSIKGQGQGDKIDHLQFVEERFGRNLDMSLAANAKVAIRRRIAGTLTADVNLEDALSISEEAYSARQTQGLSVDDVYLWPTGMSAIFNTHRTLLETRGPMKSIMFGFPYIDTLKVLEKFGPGALFYGHGSTSDLDDLESRCKQGERFLALFCEFPGNPLLRSPDLDRIRSLADRYDFAVVVDETIGNFLNVNVLPLADIVVSSLTKVFSGDSNVMGGSSILNPKGNYYQTIRDFLAKDYIDQYWPEDAVFMERNSRDFVSRSSRINTNAEALCALLKASSYIKEVYYPKYSASRSFFDARKTVTGGYGGLFSLTFYSTAEAIAFFDALETAKGPSLGTNFTLSSPFVILAHYNELEWAASFGAEADLIRVSVGLEGTKDLCAIFEKALGTIAELRTRV